MHPFQTCCAARNGHFKQHEVHLHNDSAKEARREVTLFSVGAWAIGHAAICRTFAFGCAGIALTVALLIIGDEILAGKVEDTNSSFLGRELYALGWRVVKVRPPNPCKLFCKSLKPGREQSWGR